MVLAGSTYLVTRRCSERRYFLRPSKATNGVFRYCLAYAAQKTGIKLHSYCVMSNHFHLVLTDPDARLPRFMQWLNAMLARALNAHLGRWEAFWAPGSYSAVRLESRDAVLRKIVYTLANPVSSGLVRSAHDWPGLWSSPRAIGASPVQVPRPAIFFASNGKMPATCPLTLVRPPQFSELSDEEFQTLVQQSLDEREKALQAEFDAQGVAFLGRKDVLEQKPTDAPTSREPRRGLNPRVAERDATLRAAALNGLMAFWAAYRIALDAFRRGVADVVFPAGTYWLRVHLGVRCAEPAPS